MEEGTASAESLFPQQRACVLGMAACCHINFARILLAPLHIHLASSLHSQQPHRLLASIVSIHIIPHLSRSIILIITDWPRQTVQGKHYSALLPRDGSSGTLALQGNPHFTPSLASVMEGEGTGNVCGQKLEGAGLLGSEPAAASIDTGTMGPSDDPAQLTAAFLAAKSRQAWGLHDLPHDTELSGYEDANTEDALGRFHVAETPERIAAPPAGMSLPSWLKLIFRPVHMMGIDYELLASTYYRFFKAPHIPETALVSMLKKVFGDHVERREQQGGQWIVGLRWATRDEALDALGVQVVNMVSSKITEMGGIVERVRGYMVEYNGLTKLVDFQTMERDQQTNERAKQKAAASSKLIKRKRQTPPPPPPPDLPDSPPPPPPRDIETDLENVKASSDWRDIFEWLNESITADIGDNDALEAELEVADVYLALRKKYAEELLAHPAVASIDIPLMTRILHQVFPSSTLRASEEARYVGLAWRVLEHPVKSLVVGSKAVPERVRNEVRWPC